MSAPVAQVARSPIQPSDGILRRQISSTRVRCRESNLHRGQSHPVATHHRMVMKRNTAAGEASCGFLRSNLMPVPARLPYASALKRGSKMQGKSGALSAISAQYLGPVRLKAIGEGTAGAFSSALRDSQVKSALFADHDLALSQICVGCENVVEKDRELLS